MWTLFGVHGCLSNIYDNVALYMHLNYTKLVCKSCHISHKEIYIFSYLYNYYGLILFKYNAHSNIKGWEKKKYAFPYSFHELNKTQRTD